MLSQCIVAPEFYRGGRVVIVDILDCDRPFALRSVMRVFPTVHLVATASSDGLAGLVNGISLRVQLGPVFGDSHRDAFGCGTRTEL